MNLLTLLLLCALCGMGTALGMAVHRLRLQEQSMEDAAHRIADYILDRRKGGIACDEEGAMYHLFHEVNSLVAIADARAGSERQAKEFLRDTISDISHQLKTPIAALNIYNGILQQEVEDAAAVRKFTALSEQEGKEIGLEGDEQAVLLCDRVWLTEAIGNLIKNALDHTDQGDRILIRWQQSPCLTQITVEDTGSGIHPEDLYHIFKRFYRSRFSKDTQGAGLGLPLAKSIIEAHGGSIEVQSELGRGTTFTISFPIMTNL